jgi:diaminohydroxyphosphoribosylaminopyrimidine deaminase/5-amino-6-(5-phosphoribosylamino)uracil reductase
MSIDESGGESGGGPAEGLGLGDLSDETSDELSERFKALSERAKKLIELAEPPDGGSEAHDGRSATPDGGSVTPDGGSSSRVRGSELSADGRGARGKALGSRAGGPGSTGDSEGAGGAERQQGDWTEGLSDRFKKLSERAKKLASTTADGPITGGRAERDPADGDPADGNSADGGIEKAADEGWMGLAVQAAERVRGRTSPNPWVGAVVVSPESGAGGTGAGGESGTRYFTGATAPAGGPHAEVTALAAAGDQAVGATLYVTLEPCAHHGRTPPCTDAIVAAGIRRVVVGMKDPDRRVAGAGIDALNAAGLEVVVGVGADAVTDQLAPYACHRLTGRPWVVLKLAATLDGRTAAPDGTSQWLTGEAARADAHRLRSRSDAVLVGAGTVRADDPALTVRLSPDDPDALPPDQQPLRVVLGHAPSKAKVHPAVELQGDLGEALDELGRRGVLQLLVEGGPSVAHAFHAAGMVDQYVIYLAPALFGGDDALPLFAGAGAPTLSELWRGSVRSVTSLGGDLRVELSARKRPGPDGPD